MQLLLVLDSDIEMMGSMMLESTMNSVDYLSELWNEIFVKVQQIMTALAVLTIITLSLTSPKLSNAEKIAPPHISQMNHVSVSPVQRSARNATDLLPMSA